MSIIPKWDSTGLHILDPLDSTGHKSKYITILQELALLRYLPDGYGALAVDVGCGYGRLTPVLLKKGWNAIGIDPSETLLDFARKNYPGPIYQCGRLPDLPCSSGSIDLLLLQNVLRALKIMNKLELLTGIGDYLTPAGQIFVVENIRVGSLNYLREAEIVTIMEQEGLVLSKSIPLRSARWWVIYLIRYGLIPGRWYNHIANFELNRMANRKDRPSWQYWNVLFVFCKSAT